MMTFESSAASTLLFRTYSTSSAGSLVAGKRIKEPRRLTTDELDDEFACHRIKDSPTPTALISTTKSVLTALRFALNKTYVDEEPPDRVRIVTISMPVNNTILCHSAETLAKKQGVQCPMIYRNEYLFEGVIPKDLVVHTVSVQTLLQRGLDLERYQSDWQGVPPVAELRTLIGEDMLNTSFDVGWWVCSFARCFGARAPVRRIVHALIRDCMRLLSTDYDAQTCCIRYGSNTARIDFDYFVRRDEGVEECSLEWETDPDFVLNSTDYWEHAEHERAEMGEMWQIYWDFVEADIVAFGKISPESCVERTRLLKLDDQLEARLERAAIAIGL